MQNIIICEDNNEQSLYLKKIILSEITDCNLLIYASGNELLKDVYSFDEYSIFFMDIVLPDQDGIDLAKQITTTVKNAVIIFISAYLNKVVDIYEIKHCYFIYKPELEIRLNSALNKALKLISESKQKITLHLKNKIIVLSLKDILYLERDKRTTIIYCFNSMYECSYDLQYFLENLPDSFVLCHRSFVVNLNNVKEFTRTDFILQNNKKIPVSRSHSQEMKDKFTIFLFQNI